MNKDPPSILSAIASMKAVIEAEGRELAEIRVTNTFYSKIKRELEPYKGFIREDGIISRVFDVPLILDSKLENYIQFKAIYSHDRKLID